MHERALRARASELEAAEQHIVALEEQMRSSVFSNIRGWRATFGITKQIGTHAVVETGYSFARYSGGALQALDSTTPGSPFKESQHGVRLIYTRDRDFRRFDAAYAEFFTGPPPARSIIRADLVIDCKVEIEMVAYKPL